MSVIGSRRTDGVVLPLVLVVALLLSGAMVTFLRRSVIDAMAVANRDRASRAEALARGGVRIGTALAVNDRFSKTLQRLSEGSAPGASLQDIWARVGQTKFTNEEGDVLRVRVEDAGARLNLNALVPIGAQGAEARPSEEAEEMLVAVLDKVLTELEPKTEERVYDPRVLARNLLDYMDADDVAIDGHREDDYYLGLDPPRTAANRPLLSVDEIALVEGFDVQLAAALRPYVTVFPFVNAQGIDLNTAPPHVLALVFHGSSGDMRLANEAIVRQILQLRDQDAAICRDSPKKAENCVTLAEVGLGEGGIYPQATMPADATTFLITAEARAGEITRTIEAALDVSDLEQPVLLSWRMH